MNPGTILFIFICGMLSTLLWGISIGKGMHECPWEIKGYACKGSDCDHSIGAIKRAKEDMER